MTKYTGYVRVHFKATVTSDSRNGEAQGISKQSQETGVPMRDCIHNSQNNPFPDWGRFLQVKDRGRG